MLMRAQEDVSDPTETADTELNSAGGNVHKGPHLLGSERAKHLHTLIVDRADGGRAFEQNTRVLVKPAVNSLFVTFS